MRCLLPSRPICELKVGTAVLPAAVLDRSEGGFAVLVSGEPPAPKRRVQLHTKLGWFDCRVAYVRRIVRLPELNAASLTEQEPFDQSDAESLATADTCCGTPTENEEWFRVGLQSLGIVPPPR